MKNLLATLLVTVAAGAMIGSAMVQQPQPGGSIMWGGIRLYQKAPPPAEQRAACANPVESGLGPDAASERVGVVRAPEPGSSARRTMTG